MQRSVLTGDELSPTTQQVLNVLDLVERGVWGDDDPSTATDGLDAIDLSAHGIQNFNWLANVYNALSADGDAVIIDLAAARVRARQERMKGDRMVACRVCAGPRAPRTSC